MRFASLTISAKGRSPLGETAGVADRSGAEADDAGVGAAEASAAALATGEDPAATCAVTDGTEPQPASSPISSDDDNNWRAGRGVEDDFMVDCKWTGQHEAPFMPPCERGHRANR